VRTPERARVGSFLLLALPWSRSSSSGRGRRASSAPAQAACAGLTSGGRPLPGGTRVAGIVGAFFALLNVVLTVGGVVLTPLIG
jgi:hypothetical protein